MRIAQKVKKVKGTPRGVRERRQCYNEALLICRIHLSALSAGAISEAMGLAVYSNALLTVYWCQLLVAMGIDEPGKKWRQVRLLPFSNIPV